VLSLIFDEYLEIAFVVKYLLEVFFDLGDQNFILLKPLLVVFVLILKRSNLLFNLPELTICLLQDLLQFLVLFVSLTLKTFKLFVRISAFCDFLEHFSLFLLHAKLVVLVVCDLLFQTFL